MIRWCAYCQTYQGEKPPLEDFSLTHTICERCASDPSRRSGDAVDRLEPVRDLFRRLAEPRIDDTPAKTVSAALGLAVAPIDLLLGIVQPVLYDVGARWERGELTIEEEHEITRRCLAVYEALVARHGHLDALRSAARPDVLLACAPGNVHSLGLRVIELFLIFEGFSVHTVLEARSASELIELASTLRPRMIGLSAALEGQLEGASEVIAGLAAEPATKGIAVCVGGRAIHEPGRELPADLVPCRDFRDFPSLLEDLAQRDTPRRASPRSAPRLP
jgi:methanogenic corrinoid protein MtbC1